MIDTVAYVNTDRELWREREGDYYADSIFVTKDDLIGINCGGYCTVMPIRKWHELAKQAYAAGEPVAASNSPQIKTFAGSGDTPDHIVDSNKMVTRPTNAELVQLLLDNDLRYAEAYRAFGVLKPYLKAEG